ncbi:Glycosyl transferase family 2 [Xylanibacter ruminicola]|uniref:glycosyltransferase n=1 Tax=Xylanibacter ruminicola TaxID=839 RepID=UPI0008DFD10F|nr:glycosyltransferase [Xylanibacter ruminicola]SFC55998.1 Glycosyl transferase family 2 [Xylanibacter ruminicola]
MKVYSKSKEKKYWHVIRFGIAKLKRDIQIHRLSRTCLKEIGVTDKKRDTQIVVSLTSYPARINTIHLDIRTLLDQELKPDHVILSLAESQFPNKEKDLPCDLLDLVPFGLEINWCEDIRSFKKLIPIYSQYKNHVIVTADDDLYYSRDWLRKLYRSYEENPDCIQCQIVNVFFTDENKDLYWVRDQWLYHKEPSYLNSLVGCGGVLYPPNCLYEDIDNKQLFMQLAPTNDDLWFWFMAILKGTKVKVVKGRDPMNKPIKETLESGLCYENNASGKSPFIEQLTNLLNHYPQVQEILINS